MFLFFDMNFSTVVSQQEGSRFNSQLVLSVWSLHVPSMYAWGLSGYSGFLPLSKNMHVRLIGVSKIVLRSEWERVCGCLSHLSLCGPVMDWRPVQGVPRLSLDDRWDRLQPPRDPTDRLRGYRKWMDGYINPEGIGLQTTMLLSPFPLPLYILKLD